MTRRRSLRGVVTFIWAALVSILMVAMMTPGANADPSDEPSTLAIHKLEQPSLYGEPASGHQQDTSGMTPIDGVTYSATLVPGIDPSSNQGMEDARNLSIAEALQRTANQAPAESRTTGEDGPGQANMTLAGGLYLIQEVSGPAGVVESAPFLVPMPYVDSSGQRLDVVHVYPKNAVVDASLAVNDQSAVTCGDPVSWSSRTGVPHQKSIGQYTVQNLLSQGQERVGEPTVSLSSGPALRLSDYAISYPSIDGRQTIQVTFTATGLAKLVQAREASPTAQVAIDYQTRVLQPGEHTNEVRLLAGDNALSGASPAITDTATSKFGALNIVVHQKGNPQNRIPGATFKLYKSSEDAAAGRDPIVIDGQDTFTTDPNGTISFGCLRYSDFVDGLLRDGSDPLSREYVAVPQTYPEGWSGDMTPLGGKVDQATASKAVTLQFNVWKPEPGPGTEPGPKPLPTTGASVAGVALLGIVAIGVGWVLVARKREEDDERSGEAQG